MCPCVYGVSKVNTAYRSDARARPEDAQTRCQAATIALFMIGHALANANLSFRSDFAQPLDRAELEPFRNRFNGGAWKKARLRVHFAAWIRQH